MAKEFDKNKTRAVLTQTKAGYSMRAVLSLKDEGHRSRNFASASEKK